MTITIVPAFTEEDKAIIELGETPMDVFMATWRVLLEKVGLNFDEMTSIDPTAFKLQREDALWASKVSLEKTEDLREREGIIMVWLNNGPGTY